MIISSAYRLSRSFDFLKMKSVTSHIGILAPRRTSSITHSTHWGSVAFFSRKAANIRPAPHSAFDMGPAGPTRPSLLLSEYERSMYILLPPPRSAPAVSARETAMENPGLLGPLTAPRRCTWPPLPWHIGGRQAEGSLSLASSHLTAGMIS